MKKTLVIAGMIVIVVLLAFIAVRGWRAAPSTNAPKLIGGDKDAGGCLIAAGYSWCEARKECIRPWETFCTAAMPKVAPFSCDGGKSLTATFYPQDDKYVDLDLGNFNRFSLRHATSASGARYVNGDESFVFWNKGNTAFITDNGTTTYSGCVTQVQ